MVLVLTGHWRQIGAGLCSDILLRKKKIEENLKKYKQILNIAEYRESIASAGSSVPVESFNHERLLKLDQLMMPSQRRNQGL